VNFHDNKIDPENGKIAIFGGKTMENGINIVLGIIISSVCLWESSGADVFLSGEQYFVKKCVVVKLGAINIVIRNLQLVAYYD